MDKTERELEFLKIKKHNVERGFNSYVDNYKHSVVYIVALVGAFSGILFSLGNTKSVPFIIIGGLGIMCYKFIMVLIKTNELNKSEGKIKNSMDKRFEKLGVNIKMIEEEIKLKD
ncbi:MAG: hypothetical protein NTW17_00385 [Candidatus Pacearchaeota archaeon]|nr:hypothetical protein [Candidatus Pacearchaeota archaeon]